MFNKNDMFYSDYKWTARVNLDNPKIIGSNDHSELNRTEGYEMLYFIRSLGKSWDWKEDAIKSFQKLEKTIKLKVPANIRKHSEIKKWIEVNFKDFWDAL